MIVETQTNTVAASCHYLRLAIEREQTHSCIADFAISVPRLNSAQIRRCFLRLGKRRQIFSNHLVRWTVSPHTSAVDPDAARTQILYRGHIVGYEQHRSSAAPQVFHNAQTLFLKSGVSYGEHFVYDQNIGIQMRRYRKAKSQAHSRGVPLDGRINKAIHAGKINDGLE